MRVHYLALSGLLFLSACSRAITIPDSKLASIPYEKKESMRMAKEDVDRAEALKESPDKVIAEHEQFINVAKAEQDAAKANRDVAKQQKEAAELSGKTEEIKIFKGNFALAEAQANAADAKLEYGKAALDFAKQESGFADLRLEQSQAQYELVKLRILEENGGAKDIDSAKLKKQAQKVQKKYSKVDKELSESRKERDSLKTKYEQAQAKYETAKANPDAGKSIGAPTNQPGVLLPPTPTTGPANPPLKNP
jgi:chromosome segregation ATPase